MASQMLGLVAAGRLGPKPAVTEVGAGGVLRGDPRD